MIRIRTLGAVELRRDGVDVRSVLSQPKRLALLLHLVIAAPGAALSRERLLALFWPESDDERARNALRQALHYLRRSLGDDVLSAGGEREIGVGPDAVWCDVVAFRDAVAGGRLEEALELYRGDFLPGFYIDDAPDAERWIEEQRSALRMLAVNAATSLAERAEAAGQPGLAVPHARRAVSLDPLGEAGVRRLMRVLAATGERAAALDAYRELVRMLAAELELEPAPETTALAGSLRTATAASAAGAAPVVPGAASARAAPAAPGATSAAAAPTAPDASRVGAAPAAPNTMSDAATPDSPADPPTAADTAGSGDAGGAARRARPRVLVVAAVLLVISAGVAGRALFTPRLPALEGPPAIAVLPFLNMSGDVDNDYFSDGLTEELLNVLTRVPGLKVSARTSSFAFRGKDIAIDSIARALGVTHVLEGSVRAAGRGGRLRITAQLIEASGGFHLWSETYDREPDDVFGVQDEISRAIAQKLQLELGNLFGASARETRDAEAHRLLLRAQQAFRTPTAESFAHGVMLLDEAIRRDPQYARAWGSLANAVAWQGELGWADRDSAFDRAEALARRALQLGEPPEAHITLARLAEMRAWSPDSADAHFRRALELNPSDVRTLQQRARFLARSGRGDEAIASAQRATELDPLHPGAWNSYAQVFHMLDRYDDAVAAMEQARRAAPDDRIVLTNLANFYSAAGRLDDAVATIERALALYPDFLDLHGLRVHLLFRSGRNDEAIAARDELERNQAFPRVTLAYLFTSTQDIDRILDLLEESARRREPDLVRIRAADTFRGLRHHPRFVKLLEQLEQR